MSTIVTRAGKGSPLTHNEVDANFNNLNTDKVENNQAVSFTTITGQTEVLRGTGQNLLLQSQDFTTTWTNSGTTDTANTSVAPDGTTTADTITSASSTAVHSITQSIATSALARVVSVFAKKGTHFYIQFSTQGDATPFANFDLDLGVVGTKAASVTSSITSVGNGWFRCTMEYTSATATTIDICLVSSASAVRRESWTTVGTETIILWGAQLEIGSVLGTYIPTTTTAVYGTPTLSFSGVSTLGLESNGALFLQPAGTGAIQAQATTSTAAGGNVRGANAVDWQTSRVAAAQVASATSATIAGGANNTASANGCMVSGRNNTASAQDAVVSGGNSNTASGVFSGIGGGLSNTSAGAFNFIGSGASNSGTANAAVTTQATTTVTSGSTAVTLSGSNASIRVGQLITGTGMVNYTYVAAISGTSLTLSQNANASGSPTLSFFTPHGVVVGGGNNQATGAYSFIGGGGDAGTAANRNVASGDWSFVGGGMRNTASGIGSVVCGGGTFDGSPNANTASGITSSILGGYNNTASGFSSSVVGSIVSTANSQASVVIGGGAGLTRAVIGYTVFPASNGPISFTAGTHQAALLILARQTTDATPTVLTSNSSAAGTTNQIILPNNSAYYFKGSVIANVTGAANGAAWSIEGAIMRGANAASTVLIDTPSINRVAASSGATAWTVAVTADTTNGGLAVTVTGAAGTTIRWVAKLETTEVTF